MGDATTTTTTATTATAATPTNIDYADNEQNPRVPEEEYVLPISYGSVAYWLGKKADEYHSHEWTVYVRGQNNADLSRVIESVTFQLHPSFAEPKRVLTEPPYEVTETGWGEFEIGIEIKFRPEVGEEKEKLMANLKLFPDADEVAKSGPQTTKKPLVVENREELIFHKPRKSFWEKVVKKSKRVLEEEDGEEDDETNNNNNNNNAGGGGSDGKKHKKVTFAYDECEAKSKHEALWKQREAKMKDDEELMKLWCAQKVTEERCRVLKAQLMVLEGQLLD
jgi:YEATS domain-containing protein 4